MLTHIGTEGDAVASVCDIARRAVIRLSTHNMELSTGITPEDKDTLKKFDQLKE